jgi:acyl carrier protein
MEEWADGPPPSPALRATMKVGPVPMRNPCTRVVQSRGSFRTGAGLSESRGERLLQSSGQISKELVSSLKELVIRTLRLEDIEPEAIVDGDALFGEGLGLDSIDALELVVAIERQYGVEIPDAAVGRRAFASITALAGFVLEKQAAGKSSHAVG